MISSKNNNKIINLPIITKINNVSNNISKYIMNIMIINIMNIIFVFSLICHSRMSMNI